MVEARAGSAQGLLDVGLAAGFELDPDAIGVGSRGNGGAGGERQGQAEAKRLYEILLLQLVQTPQKRK